jgi:hypothetical protein
MMVGTIGTVVNIVGADMPEVNKNNRRLFVEDEYDLYDVRKARPFWHDVCEVNGWEIVKDEEDFGEDYVCKINNELYFMELQVVGYWHNFSKDNISNLWISASKVDNLRKKAQEKNTKAGLIFLNCVPNRFIGIDIQEIKEKHKIDSSSGEKSYKIPLREKDVFYIYKEVLDTNCCDCLENHLSIIKKSEGRMAFALKHYNARGANGICC